MSTLYLIRHGKTQANEEHRYCGSTDLPLSENGKRELLQHRYSVANARFFTSGMQRTDETLHILFGDVPFERLPQFREVDFGIFEMKTYEELKNTPEYQQWLSGNNEENVPPGGESGEAMRLRVLSGLDALFDSRQDTVLVTHGGVIAVIMAHLYPEENKSRYAWQPAPGGGYALCKNGYNRFI